jgi:hypothetical protein
MHALQLAREGQHWREALDCHECALACEYKRHGSMSCRRAGWITGLLLTASAVSVAVHPCP